MDTPAEEHDSLPVRYFWLGLTGLLSLPLAKWWQFNRDADAVITLTALLALFFYWLHGEMARSRPSPTAGAGVCGTVLIAALTWHLCWLHVEDVWLVRTALALIPIALGLLLWGWAGLVLSARAWLGIGFWAMIAPKLIGYHEAPKWLCEMTAASAGFVLSHVGWEAHVVGTFIHLPGGSVEVATGCTGRELIELLLCMLVPPVLLLRVAWWRAGLIALAIVVGGFLTSVFRVAVMAVVVGNQARFEYWHGPEGAAWFTAVGIGLLAFLIFSAMPLRPAGGTPSRWLPPGQVWTPAVLGGLAVLGAMPALFRSGFELPVLGPVPTEIAGYRLTGTRDEPPAEFSLADSSHPFVLVRQAAYLNPLDGSRVSVILGYSPCLLQPSPVRVAMHYRWYGASADENQWHETDAAGGRVRERLSPGQVDWVAVLPPAAPPIASRTDWEKYIRRDDVRPSHWLRWLAGREPLRDKRAYWLALDWTGASSSKSDTLRHFLRQWMPPGAASALNTPP